MKKNLTNKINTRAKSADPNATKKATIATENQKATKNSGKENIVNINLGNKLLETLKKPNKK